MRIYVDVKLQGARDEIIKRALIDTGAEISLMPLPTATDIGVWRTNRQLNVVGIHTEARTMPIIVARIYFPSLNDIGGQFQFVTDNRGQELIIGMDILKPLGITIDTKTRQLSVRNETWEAFKTLSAIGVLVVGGVKLLEALSKSE